MSDIWLIVAAALVFFMQAGFLALECGLVRDQTVKSVAFKNLMDCIIATVAFCMVGFGLMFGTGDLVGLDLFGLEGLPAGTTDPHLFALYQLGFAATTLTIVSGAIAGRTGFAAYAVLSGALGLVIYPVFGHWTWGNLLVADNRPWLVELGFVDFAGSTVVHSVGAWVGLVAAMIVGPRLGRFDARDQGFRPHNYALSVLGVLVLWFGWFGFNGGSVGTDLGLVGPVILHTCLSAAAAGLAGYAHAVLVQGRKHVPEKLIGATLAGLVAITACCHVVRPWTALCVGAVAGVLHNLSFDALERLRIDDAVGVFPVHGIGGIWGTLAVALLGRSELLSLPRLGQLGVQAVGVLACAVWSVGTAIAVLLVVRATLGLRVSPQEELEGVSVAGERMHALSSPSMAGALGEGMSEAELMDLMGGEE